MIVNGRGSPIYTEVKEASCSNDLPRMLRAMEIPADPVERHFLLQNIVGYTYKLRHDDPEMRKLCERVGRQHLNEFGAIVSGFRGELGGLPPFVPSFRDLATVLAENGDYDDAVKVCEDALCFGAGDGTVSGYEGRIQRIRKQQQTKADGRASPAPRRKRYARAPEDLRAEHSSVPRFKCYFDVDEYGVATIDRMEPDQRAFYDTWCCAWKTGAPIPVDGNTSYLFCYAKSVLARRPAEAGCELNKLIEAYRDSEPRFADYCRMWRSDCYVLQGNLDRALELHPHTDLERRHAVQCDRILSLKLALGRRPVGRDVLGLQVPRISKWTKEHLDSVLKQCDAVLERLYRESGTNVLEEWAKLAHSYPFSVFTGSSHRRGTDIREYSFSDHEPARAFVRRIVHEAENAARGELGLPPVRERRHGT